jgi:hypothetical protein
MVLSVIPMIVKILLKGYILWVVLQSEDVSERIRPGALKEVSAVAVALRIYESKHTYLDSVVCDT